jgi:hypothetical protein
MISRDSRFCLAQCRCMHHIDGQHWMKDDVLSNNTRHGEILVDWSAYVP